MIIQTTALSYSAFLTEFTYIYIYTNGLISLFPGKIEVKNQWDFVESFPLYTGWIKS